MGIETAFLLGVLVGQWLLAWTLWRAIMRLMYIFGSRWASEENRRKELMG
jgi:hypothetical protein